MKIKTVVCIVAHADDLEFMAAGTVIRLVENGHQVYEVIATDNSKGSYELPAAKLARVSEEEAKNAAQVMGLDDVFFLRYKDGELSDVPLNELREKFIRIIRQVEADVLITWDPFAPYETHQDHRMVAMAATEAADFASLPLYHPEHIDQGLEPTYVAERYYFAKHPVDVNKVVDITDQIDRKIYALCMHDCQMKLTFDNIKLEMDALGTTVPIISGLSRDDYRGLIDYAIRQRSAQVGERIGVDYAEEFRYQAFDMLPHFAADEVNRVADF